MPVRLDAVADLPNSVRLDAVLDQPEPSKPRRAVQAALATEPVRLDTLEPEAPNPLQRVARAYQSYRSFPPVRRYNEFVGRLPQAIREKLLPEAPTYDPATQQLLPINVPLETLKGTAREVVAGLATFDTDVLASLIVAGPLFRMLGKIPLPNGVTLQQVFQTPMGRNFFQRAFLPPQVQAKAIAPTPEAFRPESVLVPPVPVTVQEAAEAARQGAAHILAERPLAPQEILELYRLRYGLPPEPIPALPKVPPSLPRFGDAPLPKTIPLGTTATPQKLLTAQVAEREPASEFGKLLKQQMREIEQVPLHPAKAGRSALKKIFGEEAGFVALPEDDDALKALIQGAGKVAGSQATAKFAQNINLSRIHDTSLRAAMQEYIEQRPQAATTPRITNQELLARAKALQDTPIIKQIAALPEGTLEAEAIRNSQEMLGVIQKTLENTVGPSLKAELDAAVQQYRQPASVFARALQAQAIPAEARQGLVAALDKRLASVLKDPVLGRDAALVGQMKRLRQEMLSTDVLTPDALDKLYFLWLNSILSNPLTHAVNRLSNFAFRWSKVPERFFQAVADVPTSLVTGTRQTYFGEVPAMLRGLRAKPMVPIAPGTKMDIYRSYNPFGTSAAAKALAIPTELLQREDEISKRLIGQMELYAQVYRESARLGARGPEAKLVQQAILANPSQALMNKVAKEQLYRTFQDAPSIIGQIALSARAKFKPLRYIIPFVRTPDRIAHAAFIERTPAQLANIGRKWFLWKKIGRDYSQEEFTHDLSLLLTSGSLAWWAGYQYLKGNLTGDAPTSPGERAAFYAQGKKPNAFKLGGYWIPFNRVEPWGTAIATTVNFVQDLQQSDKEAPTDRVLQALQGIAQTLTNKNYLSGLTNFIKAVSDPEAYGTRFTERSVAGFVPGVANLASQVQNPYYLNPQGVRESVMARVPGLSMAVPKRLGRFGEAQRRTPLDVGVEQISRVDGELNRLGHVIGFPAKKLGLRTLSNREYNELLELAGPLSYKTLDRMVQHPAYAVLSDAEKIKEIDAVVDEDREAARERLRIRLVSRALQGVRSAEERRRVLGKLKEQKVLTPELYFEFKDRGLIP